MIALVTGASRGIGHATAVQLIDAGYEVHGTYHESRDEATALESRYPGRVTMHQVDLASETQLKQLVAALDGLQFDALVNNAGIFEMDGFDPFDMTIWRRVIEVNLNAPVALVMALRDQINSGGAIVNVASLDGMVGSFASMAYSASKAALINVTLTMGNNFGSRNIRVNSISPGWINTGMATPESYEATGITPLGRNGRPEEVASLIRYLLSGDASFVNGANVVIDGGFGNVDYIMLQESRRESS